MDMEPTILGGSLVWVARYDVLRRMVQALLTQERIAVDTESNSLFAFQEQVCLIQFSAGDVDYLVDPLALDDLSLLAPVFANPNIEKVFHAAEYDVICLKRDFGFQIESIFDTMFAARVLGHEALGLASMLESNFGVVADKRYQRANWTKRPLSPAMMNYARMDTHFLLALRETLHGELVMADRLALAQEDFTRFSHLSVPPNISKYDPWRVAGVQTLTPRQAGVLLSLCAFRDEQARFANQPPFRILSNAVLFLLAQEMPRQREQLSEIEGLSPKLVQRYGKGLLDAIERGIVGPPAYRPHKIKPEEHLLWRLEALRTWRKTAARTIGVESDVILPRDLVEQIAQQDPQTEEELASAMRQVPWRYQNFGTQIMDALFPENQVDLNKEG